ncbi:hypothetical protein AB4Z18_10615 [Leifsonia sp. 2TAF2]|uniref:hypothetical protein n=1 Tax=Leifsonia sp. 2TAF2 TaxID=3233009 RepID=UPI003F957538
MGEGIERFLDWAAEPSGLSGGNDLRVHGPEEARSVWRIPFPDIRVSGSGFVTRDAR